MKLRCLNFAGAFKADSPEVDGQVCGEDGRLHHLDQTAVLLWPQAVEDLNALQTQPGQLRAG